ncbi:hypothetical protein PYW07_001376 [Mythimna separata]|uniref:Uncharacterized protein n=1 Tax=Mythimna separata TaxID=271217 RepID=A0AAD7YS65_MYTSE|nr:hypothetical protein PYW07_001376 [Mythimna separata]
MEGDRLIEEMLDYVNKELESDNHTAETMWNSFQDHCTQRASKELGVSKGPLKNNKKAKWWQSQVENKVKEKKDLFKTWQRSSSNEDLERYRVAKKAAKREVARARAQHDENFYSRLEKAKDDRELFRTARLRFTNSMDVRSTKYIQNKDGNLLTSNADINARWREYYSQLLNETFPSVTPENLAATEGPIQEICPEELSLAARGGATGDRRPGAGRRPRSIPPDSLRTAPTTHEHTRQPPIYAERAPHMTNVTVIRFCRLQASLKTVKIH